MKSHKRFRLKEIGVKSGNFRVLEKVEDVVTEWPHVYRSRLDAVKAIELRLGISFTKYETKRIAYEGWK